MKIITTDGKAVVVEKLHKLPQALTLFDNLDKVSYRTQAGTEITEQELQALFDVNNINCILV